MTAITISNKNFKRFAKRYQKINNVSLMDAQEQLSKVLGSNTYYDLQNNLNKEPLFSYSHYNKFMWKLNSYINSQNEINLAYFYINKESSYFGFVDQSHSEYENTISFDMYYSNSLYNIESQFHYGKNITNIFNEYIPNGKEKEWIIGFINFILTLPKIDNVITDNAYVLKIDYSCYGVVDKRYVYVDYIKEGMNGEYVSYYKDYFSDYKRKTNPQEIKDSFEV